MYARTDHPCFLAYTWEHTSTHIQEEDVEQLAMDFVAHGNNRVSKHLVMEFFTWLVLRHKEPRIAMVTEPQALSL